jgi:hypothetical protein
VIADADVDTVVDRYLQRTDGAAADGIVPHDAYRVGSGEARIRRVELQDRRGQPLSRLYLGQPFRVAVTIESARPVDDALIGLGISTLDGTRIATWFSTDAGQPLVSLPAGWHRVLDFTALDVAESGTDVYRWTVRGYVRPVASWHMLEGVAPGGGALTGKGV